MNGLARQSGFGDMFAGAPAADWRSSLSRLRPPAAADLLWWGLAVSVALSVLPDYLGEPSGPLGLVFALGGAAPCAWAWLLSRALFREHEPFKRWTLAAAGAVFVIEAVWHFAADAGAAGEARRLATNAASLVCISALMLVAAEPVASYSARAPRAERRFRQIFVGVFAAVTVLTLVWAGNASGASVAAKWADVVVAASVIVALAGARLAVNFRKRHPFAAARAAAKQPPAAALDHALAGRIRRIVDDAAFFTAPDRRIADLADALGEPEYKVSQCITGALGARNFNQLINVRRIDEARAALSDAANDARPILAIAFDCGFNSIGPFNRAFKEQTGMTPRQYRASRAAETAGG